MIVIRSLVFILFLQAATSLHPIHSHVETIQGTGFHRVKTIDIQRDPHTEPSSSLPIYIVHQRFPSNFFIDRYQIERLYKSPSAPTKNVSLVSLWTSEAALDLEKSQLGSHAFEAILTFQLSAEAKSTFMLTLTLPFHLRYPQPGPEHYTEAFLDEASLFYDDHLTARSQQQVQASLEQTKGARRKRAIVDRIPVGQPADMDSVHWILFSILWLASLYLIFQAYSSQRRCQRSNKVIHAS